MNFLLSPSPYQFPSPFVSGRTGSLRHPRRAWPGSRRRSVQRPRQRQLCRTRWCRWLWARSRKLAQGTCMGVWGRVVLGCVMWYGVVLRYSVCVCVVAYCTVLCVSVPLMGSNLSFFDLTALKKFIGLAPFVSASFTHIFSSCAPSCWSLRGSWAPPRSASPPGLLQLSCFPRLPFYPFPKRTCSAEAMGDVQKLQIWGDERCFGIWCIL